MNLQFLNNARGLAILMVVLLHALSVIPARTGLLGGVDLAFDYCTLLFVMIAGYLFVALSGGYRYGVFLKNKLQTVVTPYIMTS